MNEQHSIVHKSSRWADPPERTRMQSGPRFGTKKYSQKKCINSTDYTQASFVDTFNLLCVGKSYSNVNTGESGSRDLMS